MVGEWMKACFDESVLHSKNFWDSELLVLAIAFRPRQAFLFVWCSEKKLMLESNVNESGEILLVGNGRGSWSQKGEMINVFAVKEWLLWKHVDKLLD